MYGPACANVKEMANLLPAADMLAGGIVDYALGAAPHTGAFVVIHEENLLKRTQLAYYKMGDGPFYVFYTPYHLPHLQIASTIGRAALFQDPTVTPLGGPRCEVVAVAKRDLRAGETIDGVGGFTVYGLIENTGAARAAGTIPMGLVEGCVLRRAIARDRVVTADDVKMPPQRLSDRLWAEQRERWGSAPAPVVGRDVPVESGAAAR
jgi:predicted homoserine dehydrogenase-like protein